MKCYTDGNILDLNNEGRLSVSTKSLFRNDSEQVQLKNKLGYINYNYTNTYNFSIVEWSGIFSNDVKISMVSPEVFLGLHFITEGILGYDYNGYKGEIEAGSNDVLGFNKETPRQSIFKKKTYWSSFGVSIQEHYLKELATRFPLCFDNTFDQYLKGDEFIINPKCRLTSSEMANVISQIKHANLLGNTMDIYIEAKVLELIALQFQEKADCSIDATHNQLKRISDIEKIHEAGRLLLADLNNTPTIPRLSKVIGLNECRLKYGFKEVYNKTIFQYLFEHKMNLAQKLLLDTDCTIFEIANQCGYDEPANFSNAFKRKFGIYPREFRKRQNEILY